MLLLHATADALEQYSLGILEEEDLKAIEKHLLICDDCRAALSRTDNRILLLRQSLPEAEFNQQADKIRLKRGNVLMFQQKSSSC